MRFSVSWLAGRTEEERGKSERDRERERKRSTRLDWKSRRQLSRTIMMMKSMKKSREDEGEEKREQVGKADGNLERNKSVKK